MESSMKAIMEDIIRYDKADIRRDHNHKRDLFMRCSLIIFCLLVLITIIYFYFFASPVTSDKV